jgi:two-component system alkaline phosphatase synthesis response regulator PhoP
MSTKILVVDDEPKIVDLLRLYLERAGYKVTIAGDGQSALSVFRREKPDLVILDLMLPGIDGVEVCSRLRRESHIPVIMLTARAEEVDKLVGLEVGADDYVTKPFSPREVVARVRAVLRRSNGAPEPAQKRIELDGLLIDATRHQVTCNGKSVGLTPTEFRLLWAMAGQPQRVFSRSQLMNEALDEEFEGYERTIDAHVKNLRRKLSRACESACIETVYGVGYRFVETAHD